VSQGFSGFSDGHKECGRRMDGLVNVPFHAPPLHGARSKTRFIGAGRPEDDASLLCRGRRFARFVCVIRNFGYPIRPHVSLRRSVCVRGVNSISRFVYSLMYDFHVIFRDQNQQSQQLQSPNGPTAYANGPGSVLPRGEFAANGGDVEMRASMFG